jgi:4-amino-4-deoxy-L-arabinose transferase-like glycosyltransferase
MAAREWREAIDMRSSVLWLAVVLVCAGLLRLWALGSGIPHSVHPDEPEIVVRAVRMMKTGDLNPHFFEHPSLVIYAQLFVSCARFLSGAAGGSWQSLDQVGAADFYRAGRLLTAALGTATVLLVYLIATRWGARHALLAAGLMAVTAAHVGASHFVLPDIPMTFLLTLALLLALRAHEKETLGAFAWAGLASGLAAAAKYPGALSLFFPLTAAWMTPGATPSRVVCAVAASGAAAAGFLVGTPYALLDLPGFLNGVAGLANRYGVRPPGSAGMQLYLEYLRDGLGWPALLLTLAGFSLGIVRAVKGPGRVRWTLLVGFGLVYGYFLGNRTLVDERHLLPLLPLACILAAIAVVSGVSLLRRFEIPRAPRTALIAALTIMAVLPPAVRAIQLDRRLGRSSTQALAYAWIEQHVPRGSRFIIEADVLHLPDESYPTIQIGRPSARVHDDGRARADYLVTTSDVGPEFGRAPAGLEGHGLASLTEVARIEPDSDRPGPTLRIYKLVD